MATGSGAFGVKAGFNQSGGGYYVTLEDIKTKMFTKAADSGSGGATTVGAFSAYTWGSGGEPGGLSTFVATGKVIKDMGKTVVSAGRTFRKFQAVFSSITGTNGVGGGLTSGGSSNLSYLSFYLEIARDGAPNVIPAIARYA